MVIKIINNTRSKIPPKEQLKMLIDHYNSERYFEAENLAVSLTNEFPMHQFAWKVLGAVQKQTGRVTEALTSMLKSLQINSKDAEIHRLLGTGDDDILAMVGLPKNAMYNAIKAGGNYGEIFENNLGATSGINIERGVNASWTKGGILYSPPFR